MSRATIGKASLLINPTTSQYTPTACNILGQEKILEQIALGVNRNFPVLLVGDTGAGKTSLIRYLAHKTNNGFRRLNLNGSTTVDEFVGKTLLNKDGTYWVDGVLLDAMRNGYWLLLDELNAALPEVLFVLNALLDDDRYLVLGEKNGEVVRPHENFRLFAAMNPSSKYAGTKEMNRAFLSRFPIVINLEYPEPELEEKILSSYTTTPIETIRGLVRAGNEIRAAYKKDSIEYPCSTRDLIQAAQLSEEMEVSEATKLAILNKVDDIDKPSVSKILHLHFGNIASAPVPTENELEEEGKKLASRNKLMGIHAGIKLAEAISQSVVGGNPMGHKKQLLKILRQLDKDMFSTIETL